MIGQLGWEKIDLIRAIKHLVAMLSTLGPYQFVPFQKFKVNAFNSSYGMSCMAREAFSSRRRLEDDCENDNNDGDDHNGDLDNDSYGDDS